MFPRLLECTNVPVRELASPLVACLCEVETVFEALARLRAGADRDRIVHYYVTDCEGHLVGIAPVRRLLMAEPGTLVGEVMVHPVYSVEEDELFGSALELLAAHRLLALPVIDSDGRLTGVLDVTDTTRVLATLERQESEGKLFQTLGMRSGRQCPTILAGLGVGALLAGIAAVFQDLLVRIPAVGVWIPVVLAIATASAMRAVTQRVERFTWTKRRWERPRGRISALVVSTVGAALAGIAAGLWQRSMPFAWSVAGSLAAAFILGTALGHAVPELIRRWRMERKIAAGPVVTAAANLLALWCYLALCTALMPIAGG